MKKQTKIKSLKQIMKKNYDNLTDEEIEIVENRIEELEKQLDYFDRRDKVCCSIDGEQERYEIETELEQLKEKIY